MKSSIHAAIFQFPVVQGNFYQNLDVIYEGLKDKKADLIVLPELCTTGYFLSIDQWSLLSSNQYWEHALDFFIELANACSAYMVMTMPKTIQNKLYNIGYLINKEGILGAQAKIHITDDEKKFFTPSPVRSVEPISTPFGTIGILSCFDLWDSALFQQVKREKISLICSPCAFGSDMTPTIAKSRTLEFSIPLILCNRIGVETFENEDVDFVGLSNIWNADGQVLCHADMEKTFLSVNLPLPLQSELPFCKDLAKEMNWY